ncbi:MAG: phosphoribosylanthranilate isomerase [Alphaproteobacteria bacterium]|nr:phosphoribosylanthranilate isomerase [Alphaproteobacteria bacterium]
MNVDAKICGINDATAMQTAVAAGARYVGLVFYPPSPRALTPDAAATLAALIPNEVTKVGLFVDPDDALIDAVLSKVALDMLQLHGSESPARCVELRQHTGLPVMKAIKVADQDDIKAARDYLGSVDWLMFDAKAPKDMPGALPGGNALSFDWTLLSDQTWPVPWMLAGGINPDNVVAAVRASGAQVVDVSSGVESEPGRKDPARIEAFLAAVKNL